jgi:hypothetical protein
MKRIVAGGFAAILVLMSASLQGCGGGGAKTSVNSTTTGQELTDLKRALDQGIITQKEYDKKRREILKRS